MKACRPTPLPLESLPAGRASNPRPRRLALAALPAQALAAALGCMLLAGPVLADTPPESLSPRVLIDQALEVAQAAGEGLSWALDLGGDTLAFANEEMGRERVVKGAPYCADAVHETVQWLPDGAGGTPNRIVRRQQTRLCRDAEGRTRQETERHGRRVVYLRDPVGGENWVLDAESKSARRLGGSARIVVPRAEAGADSGAWRDYAERMRQWAQSMARSMSRGETAPAPPAPPAPAVPATPRAAPAAPAALPAPPMPGAGVGPGVSPVLITRQEGEGRDRREVEVRVLRMEDKPGAAPPPWPTSLGLRLQGLAPRGPGASSSLGSKEVEGVRAHGERTTWTIEAGRIGNDKPIQIVREVWTSPDLMLTLSSRDFDPRSGEVNYRLQNLRRGEPDPALMRLPPDVQTRGSGRAPAPAASPSARG